MTWQSIEVILAAEQEELLSELLLEYGALSVTTMAADQSEIFEVNGQVDDSWTFIKLTGLFDLSFDHNSLVERLNSIPGIEFELKDLEDKNWEQAWLDHFEPVQVANKLWIVPSWLDSIDQDAINIQIDPGMSFGTGTHESTRLCLAWLADMDLSGKTVLDYGCGSGILAIAALKLGAKNALAVDIEPRSLSATLENAEKNQVTDQIETYLPDVLPALKADVVIANILAVTIIELKCVLFDHLSNEGQLLLAGILASQESMITKAMPGLHWQTRVLGDWIALLGKRNGPD